MKPITRTQTVQKSLVVIGAIVLALSVGCGEVETPQDSVGTVDDNLATATYGLSSMWGQNSTKQKRRRKRETGERAETLLPMSQFQNDSDHGEMEFVRETGFRPYLEDETEQELVRETGFMPTPRLTLVDIESGHALLSWTSAPNVAYYLLVGRIIDEGVLEQHGTSFILRTTQASIDLDGEVWEFSVTAVGNDKARRSKASNRVQANPNAE
jgi:hypothetical protein